MPMAGVTRPRIIENHRRGFDLHIYSPNLGAGLKAM